MSAPATSLLFYRHFRFGLRDDCVAKFDGNRANGKVWPDRLRPRNIDPYTLLPRVGIYSLSRGNKCWDAG